mgnify:CR=1 FL=1
MDYVLCGFSSCISSNKLNLLEIYFENRSYVMHLVRYIFILCGEKSISYLFLLWRLHLWKFLWFCSLMSAVIMLMMTIFYWLSCWWWWHSEQNSLTSRRSQFELITNLKSYLKSFFCKLTLYVVPDLMILHRSI